MRPIAWRVIWSSAADSGHRDYPQRSAARGFYLTRKAQGYQVTIEPVFMH